MSHAHILRNAGLLSLLTLLQTGCIHLNTLPPIASASPAATSLMIEHARVFSGFADQAPANDQDILIQGDKIVAIGKHPLPQAADQRINANGKLLMPGLIDMHVHVGFSEAPPWYPTLGNPKRSLSAYVAHGVTTVVDIGGRSSELRGLAQQLQQGEIAGPRLLYAGELFSAANSHPAPLMRELLAWPLSSLAIALGVDAVTADTDVDALVAKRKQNGASLVKIMIDRIPLSSPSLAEDMARRVTHAAHQQQLPVAAHIGDDQNLQTGLNAGVDLFAHGVNRSPISETSLQRLRQAQTPVVPTLRIFTNIAAAARREDPITAADEKVMAPAARQAFRQIEPPQVTPGMYEYGQLISAQQQAMYDNCRRMHQAGIPIMAGTDSPNMGSTAGSSMHLELRQLVTQCGMTPAQALQAATATPGLWLGKWTSQQGLGRVIAGGPADLLLMDGDPTVDINQIDKLALIIANGRVIQINTDK